MRSSVTVALTVACTVAGPTHRAGALPLIDNDSHTVRLDGSLKSFVFALHYANFPRSVLAASGLGDTRWAGMAVADLRLRLEGEHQHWVKWQAHYRTQPFISSFSGALGSLSLVAASEPPRFLPLSLSAPDNPTFQWRHEIDRLNVQLRLGRTDVIIGRQAITFGVGFVWQPTDLVGTFSPLEIDQEFKPGVDAIRLNVALGDFTELSLVGALGGPRCLAGTAGADTARVYRYPNGSSCSRGSVDVSSEHSVSVARFRTTLGDWDVGLLSGWVRGDIVAGAFTVGALGRFRLRSELTFTWDLERDNTYAGSGNPDGETDAFVRAVGGIDYTFDTERPLSLLAEMYYSGFGTFDTTQYLDLAATARVAEFGEVFNLGVLYLASGVHWEPHEKTPLNLTLLANLHDPSLYLSATLTYNVGDESVFVAGANISIGRGPTIDDRGTLVARSEFGLYPTLYHVQWKTYF